ncbi:LytTR family DNA-binding domain-containing protein [Pseudooceanicola aestuarii]|uniref:LytTR family DNA-binding domain-containing protein n=1 Tax=Pseudooceanicola aestuarii TaxID=2697319 RepID=UPI0013D72DED|nr:LytTR family DNA-binding domain-containing protein [Pseudooceanicola aestuarii]
MREIIWRPPGDKKVYVFFAALLLLTILGPFGTWSRMSLIERLVFWSVSLTGVGLFMHFAISFCLRARYMERLPRTLCVCVGAALAAAPGAAVVVFTHGVMAPPILEERYFLLIYGQVALLGCVIGGVQFLEWRKTTPADRATPDRTSLPPDDAAPLTDGVPAPDADPNRPAQPLITALHRRLPPELGQDLVSISMQDHYAELTTTRGAHLVLLRLSDALAEAAGLPGQRLHRSHWAVTAHLVMLRRNQGRYWVDLSDGRSLPVSQTYLEQVRACVPEE